MAYIVVEGPIGVGKTSLSRMLATELDAQLILEIVEENPFLANFYEDKERYALNVQLFFLLSRYKQTQDVKQGGLFQHHIVSDYLFDKDFIFASLNLEGHEWQLYEDLYQQLKPNLPTPDLTIYLRAQPDLLLQRIDKRGRSFEQDMEASYLRQLGQAYDDYFEHYQGKLLVIEANNLDFVENAKDREDIIEQCLKEAQINLNSV